MRNTNCIENRVIGMEEMRKALEEFMWTFICDYCHDNPFEKPIVKFADASDAKFEELKHIVGATHHIPSDYLPGAKSVLSYALPIKRSVALRNKAPGLSSEEWADVYLLAGRMSADLNERLTAFFAEHGIKAVLPTDAGMLPSVVSNWSQRHVAYIAGHGTFGLNNMLISDVGSVVRYYSMITDMEVTPDSVPAEQRCLFKRNGSCAKCVSRCETGALTTDGFDRIKCLEICLKNQDLFGADVCGKCIVDMPCSFAGRKPE